MQAAKEKSVVRSRGRPKGATPHGEGQAVGRDALLDATVELLKTTGPSAITPVAVARATGVHPSLIRYYFRNRASLLVAVAERLMQQHRARVEAAALEADDSPRGRLFARIAAIIDLNDSFPNFHNLMVNEIAESSDPVARELIGSATSGGIGAYQAIVEAGAADESFREVDPVLLYMVVVGMSEFLPAARRQLEITRGTPIDAIALRRSYIDFVCDLVLNGIQKAT